MRKIIFFQLLVCLNTAKLPAQNKATVQQSALGAHFFVNDFQQKDSGGKRIIKPGLAVSFMTGISPHVDFAGMLGGSFPAFSGQENISSGTTNNHLLLEGDAAIRYKILSSKYWISPYLQGGVGISKYSSAYGSYLPAGIGVQIKIFEEAYFIFNAQYRLKMTSTENNHLLFSVGVAGTMNRKKKIAKFAHSESLNIPPKRSIRDSDGDGIPDSVDACPLVKGFAKYKGCPIPDSDGDGLNDEEDSCPHVAGLARYHGCPIPDRDNDGVNDEIDQCPDLPGTAANHGCPLVNQETILRVNLAAKRIFFETAKYIILVKSYSSLDTIVKILKQDRNLKLDIAGHTDNEGTAQYNQKLSENRAQAVVNYLVEKGIEQARLKFAGFGLSRPVADNTTIAGRAYNRRVEMTIHYN